LGERAGRKEKSRKERSPGNNAKKSQRLSGLPEKKGGLNTKRQEEKDGTFVGQERHGHKGETGKMPGFGAKINRHPLAR